MSTAAPLLGDPLPVELMNTVWTDRDGVHDALDDPGGAAEWLRAIAGHTDWPDGDRESMAMSDSGPLAGDLRRLRNALRRLGAEATADPRPAEPADVPDLRAAVNDVNAAAAAYPSWSALTWPANAAPTREVHAAAPGSNAVVSAIAEQAIALFGTGERNKLRACLAPGCTLYFVKNHPRREWCSAACGNRARVARHYRRRHLYNTG